MLKTNKAPPNSDREVDEGTGSSLEFETDTESEIETRNTSSPPTSIASVGSIV